MWLWPRKVPSMYETNNEINKFKNSTFVFTHSYYTGIHTRDCHGLLDFQLPTQTVLITIKVGSLILAWVEVNLMQLYVRIFVSDLLQADGFLRFPWPIELTSQYDGNIIESNVKHTYHIYIALTLFTYKWFIVAKKVNILEIKRWTQKLHSNLIDSLIPINRKNLFETNLITARLH